MTQYLSEFVANPELLRELDKRSKPIAFGADRILFRQGDVPTGLHIVKGGTVIMTMRTMGQIVMRVEAGAGSVLGLPAVVVKEPYTLSAEALEGAEVNFVTCEDFAETVRMQPQLRFEVLEVLASEVRSARRALADFPGDSGGHTVGHLD
jgi:CRP-like cAMP-binding protein